jgi:hypothetical protein
MSDQLTPDAGQVIELRHLEAGADGVRQLDDLTGVARAYARASKADNTRRAYSRDWRDFTAWCDEC